MRHKSAEADSLRPLKINYTRKNHFICIESGITYNHVSQVYFARIQGKPAVTENVLRRTVLRFDLYWSNQQINYSSNFEFVLLIISFDSFAFDQNLNRASLSSRTCFNLSAGVLESQIFN